MNTNASPKASLPVTGIFGAQLSQYDSFSNDMESELIVAEKRLPNMPKTGMFLSLHRKVRLMPAPAHPNGRKLEECWILNAAQMYPASEPLELPVADEIVTLALAAGRSPIVAALEANPDCVVLMRGRFSTLNVICEQIEPTQAATKTTPSATARRQRL